MQILTQNIDVRNQDAWEGVVLGTDFAYGLGFDAACEREDQAGSAIFLFGSSEWDAYNEGYLAGLESHGITSGERYLAAFDLVQRATTTAAEINFWVLTFDNQPVREVAQPC